MIAITQDIDAFLTTNAPDEVQLWNDYTTYSAGTLVRIVSSVYKALISNLNKDPRSNLNTYWYYWDVANQYEMLDLFEESTTNFLASGIVTFSRGTKEAIAIGNFLATSIIVEYLTGSTVLLTETYPFSTLGARINAYEYIYADFETSNTKTIYKPLKRIGTTIRVSFLRDGLSTYCGYLVSGRVTDLGNTNSSVSLTNQTIGTLVKKNATLTTTVKDTSLNVTLDFGVKNKEIPLLFIVDPSNATRYQSLIIIAKITNVSAIASDFDKSVINWELTQN